MGAAVRPLQQGRKEVQYLQLQEHCNHFVGVRRHGGRVSIGALLRSLQWNAKAYDICKHILGRYIFVVNFCRAR